MPLTFGEAAGWYRNIAAAGSCVITWRGADHMAASPVIVDRATAVPAFPRYERPALQAIGINEFAWPRDTPVSPENGLTSSLHRRRQEAGCTPARRMPATASRTAEDSPD